MKFSQVLAWRLYIWFKTRHRLFRHLGWGFVTAVLLIAVGFLVASVGHETVLAQSDGVPQNSTDVTSASMQNIRGVIDSTQVKAKKRATAKQTKPSEVMTKNHLNPSQLNLSMKIPILMYHKTPENFESQLLALEAKGYTTIHMNELEQILLGKEVGPTKPVVITFDDGFSDQSHAFELLSQHQMKATFYIIIGGQLSQGCLGAERSRHDCGDDYLNWDQIHTLAQSDLVEIGSHTFDHPDLPTLSYAEQVHQITNSKHYIEQKLGRAVTTLAYPYGRFNPTVMQIARDAGYGTAVSTLGGIDQSTNAMFELHRVRDATILP